MEFVLRIGAALHQFGVPAHRLEPLLHQVSDGLGLRGTFFVEPTSLQASFQTEAGPESRFARVQLGGDDLEKLARLDGLALRIGNSPITLQEAEAELDGILQAERRYPLALELGAFGVASATAARFFGGGGLEIAVGFLAGMLTGCLASWSQRHPETAPIFEGSAAFLIALLGTTAVALGLPVSADITVLAGLIILIPGLSLTLAVTELATRHLASGVARLAAAAVSFGAIAFGVVLAQRVATSLFGPLAPVAAVPLPEWTMLVGLALAPWAFGVLLRAAPRDLVPIAIASVIAFVGARIGAMAVGPELGAFGGAALLTATSNLAARWRHRPTTVTIVPGLLMLVPGSMGFRSLSSLLHHDWQHGMESAVQMLTVAMALVAGLLVANVFVPARRAL